MRNQLKQARHSTQWFLYDEGSWGIITTTWYPLMRHNWCQKSYLDSSPTNKQTATNLPICFFVVYVTMLSVPEIIQCTIIGSQYIMNLKTWKWSQLNLNYYPSICLLEGRKTVKPSQTIQKLGRVTEKQIVTDLCYK